MLTPFDIDTARFVVDFWKRDIGLDSREPSNHEDAVFTVGREAIITALAAYERVVAALDQYGQPAPHDPEAPLCAALRRAVEG